MILDRIRAWYGRREVLRELAEDRKQDRELDRVRFLEMLERAEAFVESDQKLPAQELCRTMSERFPRQAMESARLVKLLLQLRECDALERLMKAGLSRHDTNLFYLDGYAKAAEWRGEHAIAVERWNAVLKASPGYAGAYARAAACLSALNRLPEAEAMLARGLRHSPTDVFCLIEYAKIAETTHRYEDALERWQHMIDLPSDQSIYKHNGIIGKCQCLRKIGRGAEAEAILWPFIGRYGVKDIVLLELALIAEQRQDWDEALKRYESLRSKFPMFQPGYHGAIKIMEMLGRYTEADAVRLQLTDRFRGELWPWIGWARNASRMGDGHEVVRRWHVVRERFPNFEEPWREEANAIAALGRHEEAGALRAEQKARFGA